MVTVKTAPKNKISQKFKDLLSDDGAEVEDDEQNGVGLDEFKTYRKLEDVMDDYNERKPMSIVTLLSDKEEYAVILGKQKTCVKLEFDDDSAVEYNGLWYRKWYINDTEEKVNMTQVYYAGLNLPLLVPAILNLKRDDDRVEGEDEDNDEESLVGYYATIRSDWTEMKRNGVFHYSNH